MSKGCAVRYLSATVCQYLGEQERTGRPGKVRRRGNAWFISSEAIRPTGTLCLRSDAMMQQLRGIGFALFTSLAICGAPGQASAADSFELTSIKAVRPFLVSTLTALQQKDIAKAKDDFEAYDGAWNGI